MQLIVRSLLYTYNSWHTCIFDFMQRFHLEEVDASALAPGPAWNLYRNRAGLIPTRTGWRRLKAGRKALRRSVPHLMLAPLITMDAHKPAAWGTYYELPQLQHDGQVVGEPRWTRTRYGFSNFIIESSIYQRQLITEGAVDFRIMLMMTELISGGAMTSNIHGIYVNSAIGCTFRLRYVNLARSHNNNLISVKYSYYLFTEK